jgi:hypothetical protein
MAKSMGTLVDELTSIEIQRWSAEDAMLSSGLDVETRHACAMRLHDIDEQRAEIIRELDALWSTIVYGAADAPRARHAARGIEAPAERDEDDPAHRPDNVVPFVRPRRA